MMIIKVNEKGIGHGLILSKEFVELNSDKISVESKENESSKFIFIVPLFGNQSGMAKS